MSIDRYAKFISEQTRISKLDEAKKDNSEERIPKGRLGISFLHPGHYNLVDHKDRVFGSVTKGPSPLDGKHGIHVRYNPDHPDNPHHAMISFHTPEGTGFDYSPGGGHDEILNRAIETVNDFHTRLQKKFSS